MSSRSPARAQPRGLVVAVAAWLAVLCVLATLNAGGYRYAAVDQAFYLPAVRHALDPTLFPHDGPLLAAQDHLEVFDEIAAAFAGVTGLTLPWTFALGYAAGLALLFVAAALVGRRLYTSWWAVAALGLALTFRHRITKTGVNTLEGYLHPRMLAYALGLTAVAAFLRGRYGVMAALVAAAGLLHPTMGASFAAWLLVAVAVAEPRLRRSLAALAAAGALAVAWAVTLGPLQGRLVRMDEAWVSVLAAKDYLFPSLWPADAWIVNLAYPVIVVAIFMMRRRAGLSSAREAGLVAGALVLVAGFLAALPLISARVALAVQLQIPRVFWFLDLLATVCVVWLLVEHPRWRRAHVGAVLVGVLAVASLWRGVYVTYVEGESRPSGPRFAIVGLPANDWGDVMRWLEGTPAGTNVLADPGHGWRYGSSVRAAAGRDVYLEEVKDAAFAIYSRDIAMRVAERAAALGDFSTLSADEARALARRYDLDYLVTERALDLPLAYRAGRFFVYRLVTSSVRARP